MISFSPIAVRRTAMVALVAVVSVVAGGARSVHAHTASARFHLALKRAEPGVNDTVASSPAAIKLWFTESVTAATVAARVMTHDEMAVKTGTLTVDAAPMAPAVVPIPETLAPGTYTVAWKAMADDGHPTTGKFTFTIRRAH